MKPAHTLSITLLSLIALGHVLRLVFRWDLVIGGLTIPMWPSGLVIIGFLALAIALWRESRPTAV